MDLIYAAFYQNVQFFAKIFISIALQRIKQVDLCTVQRTNSET